MGHLTEIEELLVLHEGEELKPYRCTDGKLTIGVGRNLEDMGISRAESRFMLRNDVLRVQDELLSAVPAYRDLDEVRQMVLEDMCFNLGLTRFLAFRRMLAALERRDWETAAREMLDSRWARQVGARAERLEKMMLTGRLP